MIYSSLADTSKGFLNFWYFSLEEFRVQVEMLYILFLTVDMSYLWPKVIISGGCAKFRSVAFLQIQYAVWLPSLTDIIKMAIIQLIFVLEM